MNRLITHSVWILTLATLASTEKGCQMNPNQANDPNTPTVDKGQAPQQETTMPQNETKTDKTTDIPQTEREWAQRLTPQQYKILRKKGTERPYTGKYLKHNDKGIYTCAGCGNQLFVSDSKFDSHCGWPAFSSPKDKETVTETVDTSHGMVRTEITCSKCGSHLGHVFNDGPAPTGQRYCINSLSLDFEEQDPKKETQPPDSDK